MTTPRDIITKITAKLLADPERYSELDLVYKLIVDGEDGGSWLVSCNQSLGVSEAAGEGAADCAVDCTVDCTMQLTGSDLVKLVEGQLNPQMAFLQGKVKVSGDTLAALRLEEFLK